MQKWEYAELLWEELDNFEIQLVLYHYDSEEPSGANKYTYGGKKGTFGELSTDVEMRKHLAELGRTGWEVIQIDFHDSSYPRWYLKRLLAD